MEQIEAEFNPDFITRILSRIDYPALVSTAFSLGIAQLPPNLEDEPSVETLQVLHKVLMENKVSQGILVCPGCAREYPITDSIPNMLLNETEV